MSNPFTAPREKKRRVLYTVGDPIVVKADCKAGAFLPIGEKPIVRINGKAETNPAGSESVAMQVIKYGHWTNAVLFPASELERKTQNWVEVLWIGPDGLVRSTLFKGESRDRFLRKMIEIEAKGEGLKNYTDYVVNARMAPRTSTKYNSDYFAVEFTAEPISPEDFDRNKEFAATNYDAVFAARTALEFVRQNIPAVTDQKEQAFAALEMLAANGFITNDVMQAQSKLLGALAEKYTE